jgi:ribosomal protein S12 methylthiotransferase
MLMHQLDQNRFKLIFEPSDIHSIDTIIINSCGFILDAKEESVNTILQFTEARKKGNIRKLIVMGCLSQRYREELRQAIPEVDAFFGVNELPEIINHIGGTFHRERFGERRLTTPSHYAYLKIAEGCDRRCSFCVIPVIRGPHRSRPEEEIIIEAKKLVTKGVKEIILIAQDTTYYGLDLYRKRRLPHLVDQLASLPGVEWIRIHYSYPDHFPLHLLDIMQQKNKICRYIDMPLQHISDRILRSMKRGISSDKTRRLIEMIRNKLPDVVIRTTFIVGYPGETDTEFNELLHFTNETEFERLGAFMYSAEEGTHAFRLGKNVSESLKKERMEILMQQQDKISMRLNQKKIGQVCKAVIDRIEGGYLIARTEADSPEIDNEVLIPISSNHPDPGSFCTIKITGTESFDLYARIV